MYPSVIVDSTYIKERELTWCCSLITYFAVTTNPSDIAAYNPPKSGQAFNQGGTFIFRGKDTIYAHYDEATSAHADVATVINLAIKASTPA